MSGTRRRRPRSSGGRGALAVGLEQRVPAPAPDDLDDVPARAAEHGLELLDDLAVAADRAVEALQVAVDDEDQVVELLARGERDRAERLGLVGLAVAEEGPHLAALGLRHPAALEVLHEPRLVDRHDRPEAHRDGRELPELRHQPRVRIRRQALAVEAALLVELLAEALHLLVAQTALEVRARVHARGGVALDEDEVAAVRVRRRVPEVVEADLVERCGRLEARDVPAELARLLVGLHDHRDRVPADRRADLVLELEVARERRLELGRDRVDVRGRALVGWRRADAPGPVDDALDELLRALHAVVRHDRVERLEPLPRLLRVYVGRMHRLSLGLRSPHNLDVRARMAPVPVTMARHGEHLRAGMGRRARRAAVPVAPVADRPADRRAAARRVAVRAAAGRGVVPAAHPLRERGDARGGLRAPDVADAVRLA